MAVRPAKGTLYSIAEQLAAERQAKKSKSQLDLGIDPDQSKTISDPITFAEAKWGLNQKLWPTQKFVLKCFFRMPLDDKEKVIKVREYPKEDVIGMFTEKEFAKYLKDRGMSNIDPDNIHDARQLVLAMGRRSSKTFMSSIIICYTLYRLIKMGNPQEKFGLSNGEKIKIANVASTGDQAGVLFGMVTNHLTNSNFFKRYIHKVLEKSCKLYTPWDLEQKRKRPSLELQSYACSAKSLRGAGIIIAVMDELAHFDLTGGPSSDEKIYTAFAPSIVTFGEEGRLISISSPLGETGKFYRMFTQGIGSEGKPPDKTFMCLQLPSWIMNPTISMKVLEEMESADPDNFYAEYGASFLASTSLSFIQKTELLKACVDKGRTSVLKRAGNHRYYMAIDVGFVNDGFAVAVAHPEEDKIVVDYTNRFFAGEYPYEDIEALDPEEMAGYVAEVYNTFKPVVSSMDQWETFSFHSILKNYGVSMERIPVDRKLDAEMYKRFRDRVYQGLIRLPDDPDLLQELRTLRVSSKVKYSMKVEAPSGSHDDLADAVVRACFLCEKEYFDYKNKPAKAVTISLSKTGKDPRLSHFNRTVSKIRRGLKR